MWALHAPGPGPPWDNLSLQDHWRGKRTSGPGSKLSFLRALGLVWAKEFSPFFSEPRAAVTQLCPEALVPPDAVTAVGVRRALVAELLMPAAPRMAAAWCLLKLLES